ncbi:hypothetical protein [Guyparkeria sp. SCN-R1]|uniref:hypothetical protein n=1 Tax=Guyparkeria sp. SCN-R1 TaxID=2341113 RepID=UPI001315926A|nr:hypothetical protein [Guyparkeria sp. SCN-R1]
MCASIALAGGAGLMLGACTTTIVPPASVDRPQSVFVLDHGRHSSLVLPHPEGFVRYAYGDWGWYAEVDTGTIEASRAVLLPTRAGLGQSLTEAPPTREGVRGGLRVGIQEIHEIPVETERVATLRSSLEGLHRDNEDSLKYNAVYDLAFVEHPEAYAFWNNSNHKVAEWLRQLGCGIEGSAFWASWQVKRRDSAAAGVGVKSKRDQNPFFSDRGSATWLVEDDI